MQRLPSRVFIPRNIIDDFESGNDEAITDYLSNNYGVLVTSYVVSRNGYAEAINIVWDTKDLGDSEYSALFGTETECQKMQRERRGIYRPSTVSGEHAWGRWMGELGSFWGRSRSCNFCGKKQFYEDLNPHRRTPQPLTAEELRFWSTKMIKEAEEGARGASDFVEFVKPLVVNFRREDIILYSPRWHAFYPSKKPVHFDESFPSDYLTSMGIVGDAVKEPRSRHITLVVTKPFRIVIPLGTVAEVTGHGYGFGAEDYSVTIYNYPLDDMYSLKELYVNVTSDYVRPFYKTPPRQTF